MRPQTKKPDYQNGYQALSSSFGNPATFLQGLLAFRHCFTAVLALSWSYLYGIYCYLRLSKHKSSVNYCILHKFEFVFGLGMVVMIIYILAIPDVICFRDNCFWENFIFGMRNPHFGWIMDFGYEEKAANNCIYLLANQDIVKPKMLRFLQHI